jgi:hypothetical protein
MIVTKALVKRRLDIAGIRSTDLCHPMLHTEF